MDESNSEYKNKIEEKQEDMFDPHKLQQNILKEEDRSYQNNFIDFGDEDILEEDFVQKPKPPSKNVFEEEPKKEEDSSIKKSTRKRPKREKKTILDSDDEAPQTEMSKVEEQFSQITVD